MNGILLSRIMPTPSGDGEPPWSSDLMRDLPLILFLMNLGIIPNGESNLSALWMTHPSH